MGPPYSVCAYLTVTSLALMKWADTKGKLEVTSDPCIALQPSLRESSSISTACRELLNSAPVSKLHQKTPFLYLVKYFTRFTQRRRDDYSFLSLEVT